MAAHTTVDISQSRISCGVLELSRIDSDVERVMYAVASRLYHPSRGDPACVIIWSDINEPGQESNGLLLGNKLLEKFKSQIVDVTEPVENPKTGNIISMWTWIVNHKELKKWYIKTRASKVIHNKS